MDSPPEDKEWAYKYMIDPLTAPEPSEETGPGSHFNRAPSSPKQPAGTNSPTAKSPSANVYPTPPTSASPTRSTFHPSNPYSTASSSFPHRQVAFGAYPHSGPDRKSPDEPIGTDKGRKRNSSLGERFPGDMSHRPLDQIRREAKAADRAPHLKRAHLPGADLIDVLDRSTIGGAYHHEGPYDSVLMARNVGLQHSPVDALRESNEEAIRATPREYIKDSLVKHVPLQGTAVIPPGMSGLNGTEMRYKEGADLMREPDAPGGAYKRWDGVKYLPEDYKGKGEPSYSVEKALKGHKSDDRRRVLSGGSSYEMQPQPGASFSRQRSASGSNADIASGRPSGNALKHSDLQGEVRRSNTTGRRVGEGLKRRFGSLRRSKKTSEVDV